MNNGLSRRALGLAVITLSFIAAVFGQDPAATPPKEVVAAATGKAPVIIIPGITGSELINKNTGKTVWFSRSRDGDDDLRLPVTPNLAANRDGLVAGDILRGVKFLKFLPETEIYDQLITNLEKRAGYREAKWDDPGENGHQDTFYVFPYDWRRDNVETARLLIKRIEELKAKLGKPDLKFNVVAHSMGGLITRYAAMYGDADIPGGAPMPTWAGAKHFDKVFLLGTPNEGSVQALQTLLEGMSHFGGGINLPWVRNINRQDVFTIPSLYQLLPHPASFLVYDENLRPLKLDIFEPATWDEYDWAVWKDKKFEDRFSRVEQNNARPYFSEALRRAKLFQAALDANNSPQTPVAFYLIGSDCKETQNAILLRRDEKKGRWITQFDAKGFTRSDGQKVTSEDLKPFIFSMGDDTVTRRSLAAETIRSNGREHALPIADELISCAGHRKLVSNTEIQDRLFTLLASTV